MQKDNRLKVFDKIIEIDSKKLSSETSEDELKKIFQHLYAKVNNNFLIFAKFPSFNVNVAKG